MKARVKSYDARRGVAILVAANAFKVEARWPAIRRSGFVPDPGEEVEVEMTRGIVRRLRRMASQT